jgi:SAM domain (Sterile alpha motif)
VSAPATQQISDWLEKLGMSEYAQRFAENDINFSILSDLTDQDLKEIGVSSLGHRRQLLRAIGEFKNTSAANAPVPELPSALLTEPAPASTLASVVSPTGAATGDGARSGMSGGPLWEFRM